MTNKVPNICLNIVAEVGGLSPIYHTRKKYGEGILAMKNVDAEQAKAVGDQLGVDWDVVPLASWRRGLGVELEHGAAGGPLTDVTNDDLVATGRIALAHLFEDPQYYERLGEMEEASETFWRGKKKPSPVRGGLEALVNTNLLVVVVLVVILAVYLITKVYGAAKSRFFAGQPEMNPYSEIDGIRVLQLTV